MVMAKGGAHLGARTQRCATPEELASNMTEASFIPFMRCSHSMGCEDKARCVDLRPEYEHSGDLPDEIFYYGFDNLATSFVRRAPPSVLAIVKTPGAMVGC